MVFKIPKRREDAPRTRQAQNALKTAGKILGYFSLSVGRPPRKQPEVLDHRAAPPPPAAPIVRKRSTATYNNYKEDGPAKIALDVAVDACISTAGGARSISALTSCSGNITIPAATIRYHVKKRREEAECTIAPLPKKPKQVSLTTEDQRVFIVNTIRARDNSNNGMRRKEVILMIWQLTGAKSLKNAEAHLDYLIRKGKLPMLKRGGRVVSAQKTTTKRCQIRIDQQFRWHSLIDDVWERQALQNKPTDKFNLVSSNFMINLDETGVLASEGTVKIVGSGDRKKHEKNMDDACDSITIIRIGSAAGVSGPWIFLCRGKKLDRRSLKNLPENYSAPAGSVVVMTPNAYLNDKTWVQIASTIAEGIRSMEVIKAHPEWWVAMTLDGFSSHLVPEALKIFANCKIEVIKEEGDTSQTNQLYDQAPAKQDKAKIGDYLSIYQSEFKTLVDQWTLVVICCKALAKVTLLLGSLDLRKSIFIQDSVAHSLNGQKRLIVS